MFPDLSKITPNLNEILEPWQEIADDPRMQLISSIKTAREDDNNFELTLLLNIFFEALITSWLREKGRTDVIGDSYYHRLIAARDEGMLSKSEWRILDLLRDSRNEYAHDVEAHHPDYETPIEEQEELEEAYQLWANLPIKATIDIDVET